MLHGRHDVGCGEPLPLAHLDDGPQSSRLERAPCPDEVRPDADVRHGVLKFFQQVGRVLERVDQVVAQGACMIGLEHVEQVGERSLESCPGHGQIVFGASRLQQQCRRRVIPRGRDRSRHSSPRRRRDGRAPAAPIRSPSAASARPALRRGWSPTMSRTESAEASTLASHEACSALFPQPASGDRHCNGTACSPLDSCQLVG